LGSLWGLSMKMKVFYESKSGNGRKMVEKFKERKPDVELRPLKKA
jgi:protein involved in ribonucleotide reduction